MSAGTTGEAYLQGGEYPVTDRIRAFCDRQIASGREYQAIYAIATDDKGSLCYLHRTLLDGDRKANVEAAKNDRATGVARFAACQIGGNTPVSGVVHSGDSRGYRNCAFMPSNLPLQCVVNNELRFYGEVHCATGVNHLIIFADNDAHGAGLAAAFKCGHKNLMSCNDVEKVSIRWPDLPDFNDMLIQGVKPVNMC